MRYLVLTNNYPPHSLGGYELLCADHVRWLLAQGHDVTVVTSRYGLEPHDPDWTQGNSGETVGRILDFHWRDFEHRRPGGLALIRGERRQRRQLEDIIDRESPDAAMLWGMAALSKSLLAVLQARQLPVVAVVGESWPLWDVDSDAWLRLGRPAFLPAAAQTAWLRTGGALLGVVAPVDVRPALRAIVPVFASDYLRQVVEAGRPEWRGRGRVCLNGIDPAVFNRDRDPGAPLSTPLSLLYAGRVEERKGVHTAIEALAEAEHQGIDARLTIVGWSDAGYRRRLEGLATNLGVDGRVEWRAAVERDRLPDVYREHEALVFPTIWGEPFGLVPLEAMASSCVVLATGTGGSSEYLVDRENALLFPVEDAGALVDRLRDLIADRDLVSRLRRNGRTTAAEHTFEEFAAAILAAFAAVGQD
jgi:glycosyltransferase involved in cell wall biosynthesis